MSTSDSSLIVGGAWEKVKIIGRGGSSTVYKCVVKQTGQFIAVKEIITDGMSVDQIRAIGGEVDTIKNLNHDNIVRCFGSQQKSNKLYIILEYCNRGSLRHYYQKFGKLTEIQATRCIVQILLGLQYLHNNGIAHRDVKGANILLNKIGQLKLADFGASKRMEMESLVSGLKGTPHWMAPEVIKGTQMTTGWMKADVWSVGCTLVEILTAGLPFAEYDNPMTAMYQIASGKIPPLPPTASVEARSFVSDCCAADPDRRPSVDALLLHPFILNLVPKTDSGEWTSLNLVFDLPADKEIPESHAASSSTNHLQEEKTAVSGEVKVVIAPPVTSIPSSGTCVSNLESSGDADAALAANQFIEQKKAKKTSQPISVLTAKPPPMRKTSSRRTEEQSVSTSLTSVEFSSEKDVNGSVEDSGMSIEYQITPNMHKGRKTFANNLSTSNRSSDKETYREMSLGMEYENTPVMHRLQKNIHVSSQQNLLDAINQQSEHAVPTLDDPTQISKQNAQFTDNSEKSKYAHISEIQNDQPVIVTDVLSPRMNSLKINGSGEFFSDQGQLPSQSDCIPRISSYIRNENADVLPANQVTEVDIVVKDKKSMKSKKKNEIISENQQLVSDNRDPESANKNVSANSDSHHMSPRGRGLDVQIAGSKRKLKQSPPGVVRNRKDLIGHVPVKGTVPAHIDISLTAALPPIQMQVSTLSGSKVQNKKDRVDYSAEDIAVALEHDNSSHRPTAPLSSDRWNYSGELTSTAKNLHSSGIVPVESTLSLMHSSSAASIANISSSTNVIAEATLIAAESNFGKPSGISDMKFGLRANNQRNNNHNIALGNDNLPPAPSRNRLAALRLESHGKGARSHSAGVSNAAPVSDILGNPAITGPNKHMLPAIRVSTKAQSNDSDSSARIIQTAPVISRSNLPPISNSIGSSTPANKNGKAGALSNIKVQR